MNLNNTAFKLSAFSPGQFINDARPQVVFAGRSNVGKSSVINTLTGRKGLAKVGNSPGKTRSVNYFLADNAFYFVDLPGYGYAKVAHSTKEAWAGLIEEYFRDTGRISLGVMVIDARHKPTALDVGMASYFQQTCVPWLVLANKADKLKKGEREKNLEIARQTLVLDVTVPLIAFSGVSGLGKNQAVAEILRRVGEKA
ncbi:MAG: ribosome biogenesis GTP-binding protein YihA/YsxC [Oscillospiraceae bacterium]|jgi:GTP-binding protein|nr:ribosome biogenesis GTP-binding protein YihA/YsxC [Oscillospiraceae bacterium]